MTSDKINVSLLADLFVKKGLSDIIISPGSRNAPIVLAFANKKGVKARSIIDERSAGFYALGMALETGKAVAVACTSGSAALNYAPAIAEAYYQKIPLLVLTADRPPELIDQGDGQTIRQKDVYRNYIKASFELPVVIDDPATFQIAESIINSAIDQTQFPEPGPVQINIPFREPLYGTTDEEVSGLAFNTVLQEASDKDQITSLAETWNVSKKILVVAGQMEPDPILNTRLSALAMLDNVEVLTETTSNLYNPVFGDCIDLLVSSFKEDESVQFKPDLLLTLGGQIVSKMVKRFLRLNPPKDHWHISASGEKLDTYFSLTHSIQMQPAEFFKLMAPKIENVSSDYAEIWKKRLERIRHSREHYFNDLPFCDLSVFRDFMIELPEGIILHLGNSTPVRYSQLFGSLPKFHYRSNRGVSGIDGQVSTAAGSAMVSNKLNVIITGDLGFFYDSNALMNTDLPPNLKIIVINNSGGGIFRFIPGPDQTPFLEEFFETHHHWKADKISETFGVSYFSATNRSELMDVLPSFFTDGPEKPALLEVFTPYKLNAKVLRDYFKSLKI